MTAADGEEGVLPFGEVHGELRFSDRGGRLDGEAEDHWIAAGDTAQDTAIVVGLCFHLPLRPVHAIIRRRAFHRRKTEAVSKFDALHGGDGEHHVGQLALQRIKEGIAKPYGKAGHHTFDDAADGVSLRLGIEDGGFHLLADVLGEDGELLFTKRREGRLALSQRIEAAVLDPRDAGDMRADMDAFGREYLPGNGARKGQGRSDAAGEMAAAAVVIVSAIFHMSGVVGMSGAHTVFQNTIVLRMLIAISDLHRERCPGRAVIEIAGEDLKSVLLPARGRQCAAARSAARHIPAHGIPVDGDPCGKSVDDAADGSAMGFPKNGDFQFLSKCIAHRICPLMGSGFKVQGSGLWWRLRRNF